MRLIHRVIAVWLFAAAGCVASAAAESGDADAGFAAASAWIQERAEAVARSCRVVASDGAVIWVPDGELHYNAFWVRDFCCMLEGAPGAFDLDEARLGYLWLLARQRDDGAMPDRVEIDGTATYIPGPRERPIAEEPVTDGPPFMVKICHELVQRSGEIGLFRETAAALERGMDWVPRSPETGLVHIPLAESRCPYGFTDTVRKKGDLLFSSLLYWEASEMLERLWVRAGDLDRARRWHAAAERVRAGLEGLWDEDRGYYLAASLRCRQPDVWGTAYAVYLGLPEPARQQRIAWQFVRDFPRWALAGQVRHLLAPELWEDCLAAPETYQNGGFWSTPAGWVYWTLLLADPVLARRLITDLAADFQARASVPEWVTASASALRLYGASVAGPAAALRRAAGAGHPTPPVVGETSLSQPGMPHTVPGEGHVSLARGPLTVVIADNSAYGAEHRAGYNGIAELRHADRSENVYVPLYAGLNLEHIHDGTSRINEGPTLFEPRRHAMQLRVLGPHSVELYQPPTPTWQVESCTRFDLLDGGVIEMTFHCTPRGAGRTTRRGTFSGSSRSPRSAASMASACGPHICRSPALRRSSVSTRSSPGKPPTPRRRRDAGRGD